MAEDPGSPVRVRTALLADFAKVEQSGLFSIVGGGISAISVGILPSQLTLAVVVQLASEQNYAGAVTLEVRRPTHDSALTINGEFSVETGRLANIALNLSLLIDTPGEWVVMVTFGDGRPSVRLPFSVALSQAPE